VPSGGTTIAGAHQQHVTGLDSVDGDLLPLVSDAAPGDLRRASHERRQVAPGATGRVVLQRGAAGPHDGDDRARQQLVADERRRHGQQRDDVHAEVAVRHAAHDVPGHRHERHHDRDLPEDVAGAAGAGQMADPAGQQAQDGDPRPRGCRRREPPQPQTRRRGAHARRIAPWHPGLPGADATDRRERLAARELSSSELVRGPPARRTCRHRAVLAVSPGTRVSGPLVTAPVSIRCAIHASA